MNTIAKTTYVLFGGAILLSSCSQEEAPVDLPDGSDRRIVFHTSLPELTTKATEIAKDLSYFHLTVFDETDTRLAVDSKLIEYIDSLRIEKNHNSTKTTSEDCLWPEPGQESDRLHFFAYYPQLPDGAYLLNKTLVTDGKATAVEYGIKNYSIAKDIAAQVDFVTAYATGTMADNLFSGINLDFRHQLSRIEVMAKGVHKSCDIEIAGVSICNATMQATYSFQKSDADGVWTDTAKGDATYIFRPGDKIVTTGSEPVSIMGQKIDDDNENSAMVIPSVAGAWDYAKDMHNENMGLYLNVLLRIIDKTPTDNGKQQKQQYPYYDNSQGLNALDIPLVLFTVDNNATIIDGPVQVYKDIDGKYYTDKEKTTEYTVPQGSVVKEFGWAALPVSGNWEPGKIYTYTLDYSYGVGVHGPETPGDVAPMAGDPIISDRVGVSLGFKDWVKYSQSGTPVTVPGN